MLSHGCLGGGPSRELVIFQQWSGHVRKCAYTMATHAGSTVLRAVAVLQCLRRLQMKYRITYMRPYVCEGCHRALKTIYISVCHDNFPSSWSIRGKLMSATASLSREIRDAFGLSPRYAHFHVYSLHHWLTCSSIRWQTVMQSNIVATTWFASIWFTLWPSWPYHFTPPTSNNNTHI